MRNNTIDFLRGTALITIILIHSLVPYLSSSLPHFIWNWSQFAVQIFVFCSGYLFFSKDFHSTEKITTSYVTKRLKRLLVPYYAYLLIFIPVLYMTERSAVSVTYIWQSLLGIGGLDIGWLVLLFIQFIGVLLILKYFLKNKKYLFNIFLIIALGSSLLFLFVKIDFNYKWIMWLPWALILIYSYYFKQHENNTKILVLTTFIASILFILCYIFLRSSHRSTVFFDNKYPPNIYYLSYGIIGINTLYLLTKRISSSKIIAFYSKNSYPLYFIHSFVIFIAVLWKLPVILNPSVFFIGVLITSTLIAEILNP